MKPRSRGALRIGIGAVAAAAIAAASIGCSHSPSAPRSTPPSPTPVTSTFQRGTVVYLQNALGADTFRLGLDTAWGSSIVEVSANGENFVNAHDPGREVQIALYDGNAIYDGCAGCSGVFGWDPVQAGDLHSHGSPTLTSTLGSASLYSKSQALQWNPDDKGGGAGQGVLSDVMFEQTITPVDTFANAFHVRYVITHLGADLHTNTSQEVPAVYVNAAYDRFVFYGGVHPWANDVATFAHFQPVGTAQGVVFDSEHWGAYVNAQGRGLTVYTPSQHSYVIGFYASGSGGPSGFGTNYFAPFVTLTIGPGFTLAGDYFVIAGDYSQARRIIYALHQAISVPDVASPVGALDLPAAGATISGTVPVAGWTFSDANITSVELLVDGVVDGAASYGSPRPDVATDYAHAPTNVGFTSSLNSAKYSNGSHTLNVRVTDANGNVSIMPSATITVAN